MGDLVHMVRARYEQDRRLMQQAAAGQVGARRQVAERLFLRVRNTTYYIVHHRHDAEDVAQRTLVDILRYAASYRGESSLERWADRVAVRNALAFLKRRREREAQTLDVADRLPDTAEPHGRLERRELSRELARLLGRLTKQRRVVVVLRLIHQHSITEIADILGIPVNTVRDRLQVGRRELRKWISKDQRLRELTNRRAP